jgi:uncharacterized protein YndB with AHSA1/START domain
MSTAPVATSVSTSIVVTAPIERAFQVFTLEMGTWWPAQHHILEGELAEMRIEPQPGGRIYDVATDGNECTWGHVLAYEPPHRFLFSWDITTDWKVEADPARRSEIEVRFTDEGDGRTRVDLEHRELQRHGEGWEELAAMFSAPDAWAGTLQAFAAVLGS